MIYVEPRHKEIISKILKKYNLSVYAFGSRVKGTHQEFSDLDLCIKDHNFSDLEKFKLEQDFDNSNLPFKVDIIIWDKITDEFKQHIEKDLVLVN